MRGRSKGKNRTCPANQIMAVALDPVSDNKVVDEEADPAGGEDCYAKDDLPKKIELVVLENVKNAPDGGDNTDNVNNAS